MSIGNGHVSCLILAAGQSRRFGSAKLLHLMADGRRLIEHTIGAYLMVFDDVRVVIRESDQLMFSVVSQTRASSVINPNAALGMSQSIVAGIHSITVQDAVLIALGDMPYVAVDTLKRLAAKMQRQKIIVPRCDGREGNPVAFGGDYFAELLELEGDIGARQLIERNALNVEYLEVNDLGIFLDIDKPRDLVL